MISISGGAPGGVIDIMDSVRLNYSISEEIDTDLSAYCEITMRTASDVVRQLICEVLEGDRSLPPPNAVSIFMRNGPRRDRRTDMWISPQTLRAFGDKVEAEGYPGKSAVIAYLLSEFLRTRGSHAADELVRTTIIIDRESYARLAAIGGPQNKLPEQVMAEICQDYARQSKAQNK